MKTSKSSVVLALVLSASLVGIGGVPPTLGSTTFTVGSLVHVPDHPFAPGCEVVSQTGTNYPSAEVEPYVAISPANSSNIVGVFQQDRWSNGGSHGLVAGVSHDGGKKWTNTFAHFSVCTGGTANNGGNYERASDPWVSIAPDGTVVQVSISFNNSNTVSAVLASRSTDGGDTWSEPATLKFDSLATVFNDKESVTADPIVNGNFYVVWDRLVFPQPQASASGAEHAIGFHGPAWFTRSTDGGMTWEAARIILDPGELNQTIGNEIVVQPSGELIDGFNLIFSAANVGGQMGFNVAVMRSPDQGVTWSSPIIVNKLLTVGVKDPNTGTPIRTGDVIPQFAVDPSTGILYAVWQDGRFSGFVHDDIAFSLSIDGGVTWTAPVKINKTPEPSSGSLTNKIPAFTASVRVASDGTVAVTYYDFRNLAAGNTTTLPTNYLVVHCSARMGCTDPSLWTETPISGPFDMLNAPFAEGCFVGDYEGLASSGSTFRPFFVQANAATSAGETCVIQQPTTNPTDVFTTEAGSGL